MCDDSHVEGRAGSGTRTLRYTYVECFIPLIMLLLTDDLSNSLLLRRKVGSGM